MMEDDRTEYRGMIVTMFVFSKLEYCDYDMSDGSLLYEPASDGIRSAEALLIDIEENIGLGHSCMIYRK